MSQDSSQLLQLPYQRVPVNVDLSYDELTYQARLRITSFLNKVATGQREMLPEVVAIIQEFNRIATPHGYSPIEYKHLM